DARRGARYSAMLKSEPNAQTDKHGAGQPFDPPLPGTVDERSLGPRHNNGECGKPDEVASNDQTGHAEGRRQNGTSPWDKLWEQRDEEHGKLGIGQAR